MLLLLTSLALADDPEFSETVKDAEEVEEVDASLSAELGGSLTAGNTDFYTLNGALSGSRKWKRNQVGVSATALLGRSVVDADGSGTLDDTERSAGRTESARRLTADARYDRFVSDRSSLYVLAGALADPFAGYDLRTNEQFGVSYSILDGEDTTLLGELGVDWAQENYIDGVDPNSDQVIASRVMLGLHHAFSESVAFDDQVEVYESVLDFADLRVLNKATLSSRLSDKFSVKLSHELTFDNQPVEGFRPLDHTTRVTLVASIF